MVNKYVQIVVSAKDQASKTFIGLNGSLDKMALKFVASRLGVVALGVAIGKAVMDFASLQTKMVNVGNLTNATTEEIKTMTKEISKLSVSIGAPVETLAEALFDVVSAGISAADSMNVLTVSAKLARAGVTDTKTAVVGLVSVMNAYKLSADRVNEISDKFFKAQVNGIITIEELSSNIGKLAPIAAAAGISIDDMFTAVSVATKSGIEASTAFTALRQIVGSIIKPSKEASDAAFEYGVELNATALQSKGLTFFLKDLSDAVGGDTEKIVRMLPSVEGLSAVMAIASTDVKELKRVLDDIADSAGTTEIAFKKQVDTIAFQSDRAKSIFRAFGTQFASFWEPVILGIQKASNAFLEFILLQDRAKKNEYTPPDFSKINNIDSYKKSLHERHLLLIQETKQNKEKIDEVEEYQRDSMFKGRRKELEQLKQEKEDKAKQLDEIRNEIASFNSWESKENEKIQKEKELQIQKEKELKIQKEKDIAEAKRLANEQEKLAAELAEKLAEIEKKRIDELEKAREEALSNRLMAEIENANSIDAVARGMYKNLWDVFKETLINQLFATQIADIAKIGSTIATHLAMLNFPGAAFAASQLAVPAATVAVGVGSINALSPKLADGGIVLPKTGGTNVIMAEAGEPELALPASKVKDFLDVAGVGSGSGSITNNIYLNGKLIYREIKSLDRQNNKTKRY